MFKGKSRVGEVADRVLYVVLYVVGLLVASCRYLVGVRATAGLKWKRAENMNIVGSRN